MEHELGENASADESDDGLNWFEAIGLLVLIGTAMLYVVAVMGR